jgi:hypothetical protein
MSRIANQFGLTLAAMLSGRQGFAHLRRIVWYAWFLEHRDRSQNARPVDNEILKFYRGGMWARMVFSMMVLRLSASQDFRRQLGVLFGLVVFVSFVQIWHYFSP